MRTVTVGTAILGIGILAALPFRHRDGRSADPATQAAAVAPPLSVVPLQEVPLEQFAQQQYWPVAAQRKSIAASAEQAISAPLPPLPASYSDVAVPLATPQVIADRYSATAPLRGAWSQDRPLSSSVAASGNRAADAQPDPWQRGLPLGQPLDRTADRALVQAGAPAASPREPAGTGTALASERGAASWPSPEEVARAAQTAQQVVSPPLPDAAPQQRDAAPQQRVTLARPAAHAITSVTHAADGKATAGQQSSARDERQRFYIREPQR